MKTPCFRLTLLAVSAASMAVPGHTQTPSQKPPSKEMQAYLDAMNAKLDGIVLPEVKCDKATLPAVIEQLRAAAHDHDAVVDEARKGVNIFVKFAGRGLTTPTTPITLNLKNVSLRDALAAVSKQAGLEMKVEPYAVSFVVKS